MESSGSVERKVVLCGKEWVCGKESSVVWKAVYLWKEDESELYFTVSFTQIMIHFQL